MVAKKSRSGGAVTGKGQTATEEKTSKQTDQSAEPEMAKIYIMGKQYEVPKGLTIQKALEYAGMTLLRGCGCRGGFCGACGTVYRTEGDYKLKVALACQTVVEDGMYLTQIPFYPANKATYDIEGLSPSIESLVTNYPEFMRCLQCNTCRKVCPQDIEVMQYMAAAMRGDIEKAADLSFDCIMCGLCASRCPADTVQYYVGILCRRLYGKYLVPRAEHLRQTIKQIEDGEFDKEIEDLMNMKLDDLKDLYEARDIEPEEASELMGVSSGEVID
jgi:formate hydrogenlyase subunit 6/NADH:ubiquinone oxidoreductase subunit I